MEEIVFDCNWLKVKRTPKGYYFSERKGISSVAILLYRKFKDGEQEEIEHIEVLTRMQPLPIEHNQSNDDKVPPLLFRCPITGGNEKYEDAHSVARKEILEEAGYDIPLKELRYIGEYYVGTQTNEKVFMYVTDVNSPGVKKLEITGDGTYFESISKNEWIDIEDVLDAKYSGLFIIANKLYRAWQDGEI